MKSRACFVITAGMEPESNLKADMRENRTTLTYGALCVLDRVMTADRQSKSRITKRGANAGHAGKESPLTSKICG